VIRLHLNGRHQEKPCTSAADRNIISNLLDNVHILQQDHIRWVYYLQSAASQQHPNTQCSIVQCLQAPPMPPVATSCLHCALWTPYYKIKISINQPASSRDPPHPPIQPLRIIPPAYQPSSPEPPSSNITASEELVDDIGLAKVCCCCYTSLSLAIPSISDQRTVKVIRYDNHKIRVMTHAIETN
jgi:hypothetical protein